MASADTTRRRPSPEWEKFARRHAGSPFLELDPLYTLTEEIINEISEHIPSFFTTKQLRFERDLIRTASFGFYQRRALGLPPGTRRSGKLTRPSWEKRHARTARAINEMLRVEMRRDGLTEAEISEHFQKSRDQRKVIDTRKEAYAGWLIVNRPFRAEIKALRRKWATVMQRVGRFPVYPRWLLSDEEYDQDLPQKFRDDFLAFYRRWGLDRMLTWDWPVPMEPDLVGGIIKDLDLLTDTGLVLFVPWYALRGEKVNLQEVVQLARMSAVPAHLRDWFRKRSGRKGDELGDIRYERLRWLYRYHELALVPRYSAACRRQMQKLDAALACLLGRKEDVVKKLRLQLKRALRSG
jgi:hypothetical protein